LLDVGLFDVHDDRAGVLLHVVVITHEPVEKPGPRGEAEDELGAEP